ncbi:MAG: 30S ribosomal protein S19e [Candidatus Woesearchaeota archaeon]
MVSIYDVDPNDLIEEVAKELKKLPGIQPPEWAQFVKTGIHKERPPVDPEWWFTRVAAILRTISLRAPVGVSKLRTKYGGKQNRGFAPEKFVKGSGNILRKAMQQLEIEGLVAKSVDPKKKGRIIAPKGQSLLEKCASRIRPKIASDKKASKTEKKEASPKEPEAKSENTESPKEEPKKEAEAVKED